MADENPTGRGSAVALRIPADQARFLRSVFEIARDGVREELENYPAKLSGSARLRREAAAYGRLLAALAELVIVPDGDIRTVLGDLAKVIDQDNEYERVIVEHEALHGLLDQLG